MKVTREKVAENRRKILEVASGLFKRRGFDAVTVAEIMQAAGLTHGGFYGHFKSKEDLVVETLLQMTSTDTVGAHDLTSYAQLYLNPAHRDDLAGGCPFAALGTETVRQPPAARAALTAGLRLQLERLGQGAPGRTKRETSRAAIGTWAAILGALILSRASDDPALANEILTQTRRWLADRERVPSPTRVPRSRRSQSQSRRP